MYIYIYDIISTSNQQFKNSYYNDLHSFFLHEVFEVYCAFYSYITFQQRLASFQMLDSHTWLVPIYLNWQQNCTTFPIFSQQFLCLFLSPIHSILQLSDTLNVMCHPLILQTKKVIIVRAVESKLVAELEFINCNKKNCHQY